MILFYSDENGQAKVEVILQDENVCLNVNAIATLFDVQRPAIVKHINNIYNDEELSKESTCSVLEQVQIEGTRSVKRQKEYYNLDMIISIGFRVNSKKAIKFRSWANEIIKDYMIQGFALDDDRNSDIAKDFYATVQNKFHYAITGNTAAEIIYNRVDSKKANMGLTNWDKSPDGKILKSDVSIAKNYLNEKEIKNLNNLVNLFLDIAENNAERNLSMSMNDWKNEVETSLKLFHYEVLEGKGKISAEKARQKAENEYEKYKIIQDKKFVSDFDKLLIETEKLENH